MTRPGSLFLVLATLSTTIADDALEAWKKDEVLAPERSRPAWIEDAAGSAPWSETMQGTPIEGRRPGPSGALVGYSGLEASEVDALAGAQASATRALASVTLWSLRSSLERNPGRPLSDVQRALDSVLRSRVSSLVREIHVEALERPYGRLHRAAILVDASEAAVRSIAALLESELSESEAHRAQSRERLASTLVWAFGLLGATSIAYALLNSITSGHFRSRLRVFFLLALGASCLGVLLWKGWF